MMSLLTSSAALVTVPAAFRAAFTQAHDSSTSFFDEGPRLSDNRANAATEASGSIDTVAIDHYTQGVELTTYARWNAGIVKAWSGEVGHTLKPAVFGQDKYAFPDPRFADIDYFNAQVYVAAQSNASNPLWQPTFTFPIVVGDNDQAENFNFNGIIEPLTIRARAGFFSTDVPFEAHDTKGALMAGNLDPTKGGDRVLTVEYFMPQQVVAPYLDQVDAQFGSLAINGFFKPESSTVQAFADVRYVRNVLPPTSEDATLLGAMSAMTGSTGGYVSYKQRSAACGWDYDRTAAVGTDSLVFGGKTY